MNDKNNNNNNDNDKSYIDRSMYGFMLGDNQNNNDDDDDDDDEWVIPIETSIERKGEN